jgi:tRNA wybutosine-synthesizing protein 2
VRHVEDNFTYLFDPKKVMFAQGNLEEKRRLAALIRKSGIPERVADMYAGIGYFTIPMAAIGAFVHAIEINPVAFGYLQRNIEQNALSGHVEASCGDCRDLLFRTYDRIVMGHFDAITMLPQALKHIRSGSFIHLHSLGSVENEIRLHLERAGFSAEIHVHKVKKYRPHTWHVVQDVMIA